MFKTKLSDGTAHKLPADLANALISKTEAVHAWEDITPLARNEFICWVEEAKKPDTRANRIKRTKNELMQGKRRPCCWSGCIHRKDKPMNATQKWLKSRASK